MRAIKKNHEYKRIYKNSNKIGNESFIFLYNSLSTKELHIGIVVPKKVGPAVIRNRLRRRLKHYFREKEEFKGFEIILICRKSASKESFAGIKKMIDELIIFIKE